MIDEDTIAHAKQHLLVVDDDQGVQASLAAFLRRAGFEVSTASDGAEALALVDRLHPDLLVLDVLMPRVDGRETLRRSKKGPMTISTNPLIPTNWRRAFGPCCAACMQANYR
jgi:DNA-binding response OmpR family regulator